MISAAAQVWGLHILVPVVICGGAGKLVHESYGKQCFMKRRCVCVWLPCPGKFGIPRECIYTGIHVRTCATHISEAVQHATLSSNSVYFCTFLYLLPCYLVIFKLGADTPLRDVMCNPPYLGCLPLAVLRLWLRSQTKTWTRKVTTYSTHNGQVPRLSSHHPGIS